MEWRRWLTRAGNANSRIRYHCLTALSLEPCARRSHYLAKDVPKFERDTPAVATAAQMLTYAAERESAWLFLARIATLQAVHRNDARVFNPDRKDHHWGRRKLKRDQ
jgi:hypothetical protein